MFINDESKQKSDNQLKLICVINRVIILFSMQATV